MGTFQLTAAERLQRYLAKNNTIVEKRLGFGKDGDVWQSPRPSAIKVFNRDYAYDRERTVYARLASRGVREVRGHMIPRVLTSDDQLGVIEMTIVSPPFVLDFASAQLDSPPDFPPEVMQEWLDRKRAEFGPNTAAMLGVLAALRGVGVHMLDVHPGNIRFGNEHLLEAAGSGGGSSS